MSSKVSIVIPFYNCAYIDEAIESALAQADADVQVIVINDGSTEYNEKIRPYYQRIRYVEKGHGGTASALNMGIHNMQGEYFTWLSADDIYDPYKVAKQLQFMQQTGAQASYTAFHYMNEHENLLGQPIRYDFADKYAFYQTLAQGCPINGCTVMLHMDVFRTVGVFDETLRFTHDYDLWLRILPSYDFFYLDDPLVFYRVHSDMATNRYAADIPQEIQAVQNRHHKQMAELMGREE